MFLVEWIDFFSHRGRFLAKIFYQKGAGTSALPQGHSLTCWRPVNHITEDPVIPAVTCRFARKPGTDLSNLPANRNSRNGGRIISSVGGFIGQRRSIVAGNK